MESRAKILPFMTKKDWSDAYKHIAFWDEDAVINEKFLKTKQDWLDACI